jgi:hypothetical protein
MQNPRPDQSCYRREIAYMISQIDAFGDQIAVHLPGASPLFAITPRELRSVQDLLAAIERELPEQPIAMLRTTAGHISNYLGVPISALSIEVAEQAITGFSQYLTTRRMSRNSIRSYRNFAHESSGATVRQRSAELDQADDRARPRIRLCPTTGILLPACSHGSRLRRGVSADLSDFP